MSKYFAPKGAKKPGKTPVFVRVVLKTGVEFCFNADSFEELDETVFGLKRDFIAGKERNGTTVLVPMDNVDYFIK